MSDPYGLTAPEARPGPEGPAPRAGSARGGATSTTLWVVLAVSVALNIVSSMVGGIGVLLNIVTGVVTLACGVALYTRHRKRRGTA